ncbi:MAG: hypothetical protein AB7V43_00750 [Acidimicrobiia bacterium]
MVVSAEDRRRWNRQVAALASQPHDDEGSPSWRLAVHEWIDTERANEGREPLKTESELYRYAESLGLRRTIPRAAD